MKHVCNNPPNVIMTQALPPEGRAVVCEFIGWIGGRKVNMTKAMAEWRRMKYGYYHRKGVKP